MNDDYLYDVAVIGGGLAGLSMALQCAEANYKVILFEKETYPYHKVCGEYISLESWHFLQQRGVNLEELNLPIIKKLQLSNVHGRSYSFNLPLGGFGISRYFLDHSLYKMALAKGVNVLTNTRVIDVELNLNNFTITTNDHQIRAKVAVGSFGKRSNLDIKWKRSFTLQKANILNNYIGIKYHIKHENSDSIALHNFYHGYCGLSRIEEEKSCLCYLTTAKNLRDCGNSIQEMERSILYKNPKLKEIFTSADFLFSQPLAISQISFAKKSLVENNLLMLGDAAGMIIPLCGNGMSMAMHSSKIAVAVVMSFLSGKANREEMEKQYSMAWKKEFSKRLWVGRNVQRVFGGDLSTTVFLKTMNLMPSLAKLIIQKTHGSSF